MRTQKILVPLSGRMNAEKVMDIAFWLARDDAARVDVVEITTPPPLLQWLLPFVAAIVRRIYRSRLWSIEREAIIDREIDCRTSEQSAPTLVLGIVEAVWHSKPNVIIIAPEIGARLGEEGRREMKKRLGEIGGCVLLLAQKGLAMRIEPCPKIDAFDFVMKLSSRKQRWTVLNENSRSATA